MWGGKENDCEHSRNLHTKKNIHRSFKFQQAWCKEANSVPQYWINTHKHFSHPLEDFVLIL